MNLIDEISGKPFSLDMEGLTERLDYHFTKEQFMEDYKSLVNGREWFFQTGTAGHAMIERVIKVKAYETMSELYLEKGYISQEYHNQLLRLLKSKDDDSLHVVEAILETIKPR
jgi:hypothetical protein